MIFGYLSTQVTRYRNNLLSDRNTHNLWDLMVIIVGTGGLSKENKCQATMFPAILYSSIRVASFQNNIGYLTFF